MKNVYGYVNGKAVYSAEEFRYECRGFGEIESDEELLKYAEKVTSNWYDSGHHRTFTTYYLSDYALSEPYKSLTRAEFGRLKKMQQEAKETEKQADDAREWKKVNTIYYADNSVIEIWRDKNGVKKEVMITAPHGDACY